MISNQPDAIHPVQSFPEYIESSGDAPDTLSEKQPQEPAAI